MGLACVRYANSCLHTKRQLEIGQRGMNVKIMSKTLTLAFVGKLLSELFQTFRDNKLNGTLHFHTTFR